MAYLIGFVLLALAIPLAGEIAVHGNNNIITKSGKEVIESEFVSEIREQSKRIQKSIAAEISSIEDSIFLIILGSLLSIIFKIGRIIVDAIVELLGALFDGDD